MKSCSRCTKRVAALLPEHVDVFELYTHYMYEKIFGETFVGKVKDSLGLMREKFYDAQDKRC